MSLLLPRIALLALVGVWGLFAFALFGTVGGIAAVPPATTRRHREDQR